MTNKKSLENSKLGLFVTAGLVFLIFSLYMIGKNQSLFGSTYTVYANFSNVNGLLPGNSVRFSGIDVGTVNNIDIVNDSAVRVTMLIERKYMNYIHENAMASVGTDGLMGNKLISIKSNAEPSSVVKDGGMIMTRRPVETDEMLHTLNTTNDNIAVITSNLKEITGKLNKSNSVWSFLSDTAMATDLKKIVGDIQQSAINAKTLTRDASQVVTRIKNGKGIVMSLFTDSLLTRKLEISLSEIQQATKGLDSATHQLTLTLKKVELGKGPAGVLLTDSVSARQLKQTILNIQEGTARFNENMEAMRHNWLFKGYFKDQEKTQKDQKKVDNQKK